MWSHGIFTISLWSRHYSPIFSVKGRTREAGWHSNSLTRGRPWTLTSLSCCTGLPLSEKWWALAGIWNEAPINCKAPILSTAIWSPYASCFPRDSDTKSTALSRGQTNRDECISSPNMNALLLLFFMRWQSIYSLCWFSASSRWIKGSQNSQP